MNKSMIAKYSLQFIALCHIGVGLMLPILVSSDIFDAYLKNISHLSTLVSEESQRANKALIALFGPTIASWGALFLILTNIGISRLSRSAFYLLLVSLLVWAVYDSLVSFLFGINVNIAINAIVFTAMLIPLLILKPRNHRPH